jgi:hypothetical protein
MQAGTGRQGKVRNSIEESMMIRRPIVLSLAIAGCAAAAYAIGRRTRRLEQQQHKEELRTWEDEGGNLAPSEASAVPSPAPAA